MKPPWGRITAIDLNKGEIVWQVAHGDTPDAVKNHPRSRASTIPRTGRAGGAGGSSGGIGTLVTKTLVISGEGGTVTTPNGSAARCCAPTTRRPAPTSARSTCRARKPGRP